MKKKLLIAFLGLTLGFLIVSATSVSHINSKENSTKKFKIFHLVGTVTLSGGCVVSYNLTLDVSFIPPRFNSLSGTLTLSGNCTGTQTININQLRADIDDETKETTNLEIDEISETFSLGQHLEFVLHLQAQINEEKDEIWDPTGGL